MNIIFEWYCFQHKKIIFISSSYHVVFFLIWSEVGTSEQRTYKSCGKTHAFFTLYIFFHLFTSENMSVLVYSKTQSYNHIINTDILYSRSLLFYCIALTTVCHKLNLIHSNIFV